MNDIELVIKIPKEIQLALINNIQLSIDQQSIYDSCIKQAIINGTPLPKGHGRLIDADALPLIAIDDANHGSNFIKIAPTIIEADKAESEE
jgi:hypothetical protein